MKHIHRFTSKLKKTQDQWIPLTPGIVVCNACGWFMEGGTETQRLKAFTIHACQDDPNNPIKSTHDAI